MKDKKNYIQNSRFANKTLFSFHLFTFRTSLTGHLGLAGAAAVCHSVNAHNFVVFVYLQCCQENRAKKNTQQRMPLELRLNVIVSYALCLVCIGLYRIHLITTHLLNVPRTKRQKSDEERTKNARALPNLLLYDINACKRQSGSARAPHLPFCNKLNISAKACWGSKSLRIVINAIFLVSLTHTRTQALTQPFLRDIKHSFDGAF